jgi:DNA polymerase-4
MSRALRLCPDLAIVRSDHRVYEQISQQVMKLLHQTTSAVEQVSIDEAYLEVSDLLESGEAIAHRLQKEINDQLNLPCSLGVASNKLVAKIANDVGKRRGRGTSPPNAITVVPPGEEAAFLAPLPTISLLGVGPKTAARLEELGVRTLGELAGWPAEELAKNFGKHGYDIARGAQGIDDSPIVTFYEAKSFSQETTFAKDIRDQATLEATLQDLSKGVSRRLRESQARGSTVKLKLRWPDFTTLTRQVTLIQPIDKTSDIFRASLDLFRKVWKPGRAVRLLGVGVSHLETPEEVQSPTRQMTLWEVKEEVVGVPPKEQQLQRALELIKERYGENAVRRGKPIRRQDG